MPCPYGKWPGAKRPQRREAFCGLYDLPCGLAQDDEGLRATQNNGKEPLQKDLRLGDSGVRIRWTRRGNGPILLPGRWGVHRVHFIELHEQSWFPGFLRNDVTDTLQFGLNLSGAYAPIAPLLQGALDSTGSPSIVDLCSGGGGPWLDLVPRLRWKAGDAHVSLTDKYPNPGAFENAQAHSKGPIRFYRGSVDARNVPAELDGFRTLFTSFHHFPFEEAQAIVQNAVDAGKGIGIFEITRRSPSTLLMMVFWSLAPLVFTLFVKPFRWSRLSYTYVIPIIPFVLLFDGVVSCLRTYRPAELRGMVEKLNANGYRWDADELRDGLLRPPVTYLIGYPMRDHAGAG